MELYLHANSNVISVNSLNTIIANAMEMSKSISSHGPGEAPGSRFFHPDGKKWPSRAPGSLFSPGFGPSSIR
jgi:hypothetical protein